jgi:hypothetical protein
MALRPFILERPEMSQRLCAIAHPLTVRRERRRSIKQRWRRYIGSTMMRSGS